MCPLCITTAALSVAGAASGAGVIAVAASKWRRLKNWLRCRLLAARRIVRQGDQASGAAAHAHASGKLPRP
jgi:hypothetical protein